ncbi:MAG: ATP synthase F1 subunit delta [Acidobacteriia bacterium]|nr:ATP synthase F1 subunit delta [Terriglobia bacterium]
MAIAIANRYARALADVVARTGDYRRVQGELEDFAALYRESADLRDVLRTPAVPSQAKTQVLEAILRRLGTSLIVGNFLRLLLANYRLALLDKIITAFHKIGNDRLGVTEVAIASATELSDTEQRALIARFEALTQKRVEVQFRVAPNLLGGIEARIDSTVYDGSVRGHLERIRERLTAR